MLSWWCS